MMICLTRVALVVLGMLATAVSLAQENEVAQDKKSADKQQLLGSWRLVEAKTPGSPSGVATRLKIFTDVHWAIIQSQKDGSIVFVHGGTYKWDGNILTTNHEFAGDTTRPLLGKVTSLQVKVEGDKLIQSDAAGVYDETWERVRPAAEADIDGRAADSQKNK